MVRRKVSSGVPWALIGGLAAGGAAVISVLPMVKRRAMKVTNILRKDHRLVSGMIMTLEMTPKINGMMRRSLFSQIRRQLLVHAQAEEDVLYPAVRNMRIGNAEQLVQDSTKEHDNIKRLLQEIDRLDPVTDEFDGKVADLRRTIQHHVEDEEGKVFPMLERQWTVEQLQQVGKRLHNRKTDLKRQMAA